MLEKIVDQTASKIKTDERRDPCPEPGIVSIEAHDSTFNHDPTYDRSFDRTGHSYSTCIYVYVHTCAPLSVRVCARLMCTVHERHIVFPRFILLVRVSHWFLPRWPYSKGREENIEVIYGDEWA